MARAAYEYLIQYISDLTGITRAKRGLRKLEVYNKKFGANVGRVTKVLSRNITQSTKTMAGGATQTTRNIERTFKTASGQVYTYSRAVTTSNGKMIKSTGKLQKGFGSLGRGVQAVGRGFGMIAMRALKTIPVWLVLRAVFMQITSAITNTVKTWMDLEREMGRVAGVTRGTEKDIDSLRSAIVEFSRGASRGFKEVAGVVYALGSAGLTVTEQMAGFEHIMDVTIGTFGNAEQIAKLTAGAYNVFGQSLEDAYTISAKFKKLSDILAYTYSTQQVELSEVATAMTYVASIGSLLDISFEQLVGTIGFLNTGMLKGSKSGTALMNAFVKLAVSGDRLAKLGVVFDPSLPLDLLSVMEQLHNIYGDQALSLVNLREIMDVFGRRGGRAAAQMIDSYDRWTKTLENTHKSFHDFAEEMREKAEDTLPAAFDKFKNAWKGAFIEGIGPATKKMRDYFKVLNEEMEKRRKAMKYFEILPKGLTEIVYRPEYFPFERYRTLTEVGEVIVNQQEEWLEIILKSKKEIEGTAEIERQRIGVYDSLNELAKLRAKDVITEAELNERILLLIGNIVGEEKLFVEQLVNGVVVSKSYSDLAIKILKNTKERIKLTEKQIRQESKYAKERRKADVERIEREGKYQLMAARGWDENLISIAKMRDLRDEINNEILKQNNLTDEMIKDGKETNRIHLENVNIQEVLRGNYESLEQLIGHIPGIEKKINSIYKLRIGLSEQILAKKRETLNTVTSLVIQYGKADMFEKGRIRRALELMGKPAEDIAHAFRTSAFDEQVILDFWSVFDKTAQEEVTKTAVRMYGLSSEISNLGDIFSKQFELPKEDIYDYWRLFENASQGPIKRIGENLKATLITATGEVFVGLEKELIAQTKGGVSFPRVVPTPAAPGRYAPTKAPSPYYRGGKTYAREVEGKWFGADTLEKLERLIETYREEQEKTREKLDDVITSQKETTRVNREAF